MKIKCDYCGNTYEDTKKQCPYCAAPNPSHQNDGKPRTIRELQDWYQARKLPQENITRFFIGKDIKEPRAFGIYQDSNGDFVVYKNKNDGTRAIRYQGKDEQYAVNELYQKLKDEIVNQRSHQKKQTKKKRRGISLFQIWLIVIIVGVVIVPLIHQRTVARHNGYYTYAGNTYYRQNNDWYYYSNIYDDWEPARDDTDYTIPYEIVEQGEDSDYYEGRTWDQSIGGYDWDDSAYYEEYHSSSYDSDSGYDWDSGDSWDSGEMDWDSDW